MSCHYMKPLRYVKSTQRVRESVAILLVAATNLSLTLFKAVRANPILRTAM